MKKSLLIAAAIACAALASTAFASPPATASPGFEPAKVHAVAKDVIPTGLEVAATGSGAQSALKAYTEQRQGMTLPAQRQIGAADPDWGELSIAAAPPRLHVHSSGCDHEPGGGSWSRGPDDADGEGSETDIRRPLT